MINLKLNMKDKFSIPKEVSHVTGTLENAGFEAYIVGGCVRDLLIGKTPKDWDVTTNAKPEEIEKLFENTYYNNDYGTVGVVNDEVGDETLKVVEVTPYRLESEYSDARRPDSVEFSDSIEHDLKRRDFTINAIAYSESKGQIVDLYEGQKDIENRIVRAVGDPDVRFGEDALRILRAIRISAELGFEIEEKTKKAIKKDAKMLEKIAKERIRDEFTRIIMSDNPMKALELAHEMGVLQFIVPELEEGPDYNIDEKMKTVSISEEGIAKLEKILGIENSYDQTKGGGIRYVHQLEQALKARVMFKKDKDYVVKDGEAVIVDEFTGRLMPGRVPQHFQLRVRCLPWRCQAPVRRPRPEG